MKYGDMRGKRALLIGKFMPLHEGHLAIMRFAEAFAGDLTVVVDKVKGEEPDNKIRAEWVRAEMPNATVVALDEYTPQAPEEHPNFWNHWAGLLYRAGDGNADILVAAADYGQRLADAIGAEFIPFDPHRNGIGISATQIRSSLWDNWNYIAPAARKHYLKRVQVLGPESSGKTSLCRELAREFQTAFVPEFAQDYLALKGGQLPDGWPELFIHGQQCEEFAIQPMASRVCFCDSSAITTMAWCELLGVKCPETPIPKYDLTLVCMPDVPWQPDIHRQIVGPDARERYLQILLRLLNDNNIPYKTVSGKWFERTAEAARHVRELFH